MVQHSVASGRECLAARPTAYVARLVAARSCERPQRAGRREVRESKQARVASVTLSLVLASCTLLSAQTYRSVERPEPALLIGFGSAAAVTVDQLLIGNTGQPLFFPMPPERVGAVHVFERTGSGSEWIERALLSVSEAEVGDGFGQALSADDDLLAVGSAKAANRGAVYLFRRSADGGWSQVAKLAAPDGSSGDAFGSSVRVRSGTVFVAAPEADSARGAVYVFRENATSRSWSAQRLTGAAVEPGDRFGAALAVRDGRLLVGAPGPASFDLFGGAKPRGGAAYLFGSAGEGDWREEARLTAASEGIVGLGSAVWLDGDAVFVGAPGSFAGSGVVVEFRRAAESDRWSESALVRPQQSGPGSLFGSKLAAAAGDLLVGAPRAGGNSGAVHVFRQDEGRWREVQKLGVPMVGYGSFFGGSLAAGSGRIVVGAPAADFFEGSVYVYAKDSTTGDWRDDGTLIDERGTGMEPLVGAERRCEAGGAGGFECSDVDLLSFLPVSAIGGKRGIMVNDVWGWTDPQTGREYALVGRFDATVFLDVTDPSNPLYLGELPLHEGAVPNLWRDIKVYKDHAFIVADGSGPHGMQVFDLRQLRDVRDPPARFSETAHYDRIHSAHNIAINEESGFAYTVGNSAGGETCGGALHMIDIRNPRAPTFAGCYADPTTGRAGTGNTHDAQCVIYRGPDANYAGREICFNSSETALGIADVTDKSAPIPLAAASYPNVAYTHQGWLSDDQQYFFLNDEGDEVSGTTPHTRTIVWDVTELEDPVVLTEFQGTTAATDHNLYVRGRYMYQSNYVSGLRIIDVADPAHPREVGFFDTVPFGQNTPGFAGSWSNYPFFESGTIVVTSMREGVFLLKKRETPVLP